MFLFNIHFGFHILFPTFNIGLASFLCIMESLWLKTNNQVYLSICQFWGRIFAMTFVDAAAPAETLKFLLIAISILLPVLIFYTAYAYAVFRGKVTKAILHY